MKVLILRLSSLGDVVLTTAAIAPLRVAGCKVFFVTKPAFAPLLEEIPGIESIYCFDKKKSGGERAARREFLAWARSQKFDVILDLHDSLRTRLWRFLLRGEARIVVRRKQRLRELLVLWARLGPWLGWRRGGRARDYFETAKSVTGADIGSFSTELLVTETEIQAAERTGPYVVLVAGSAWIGKQWPVAYFESLARDLSKNFKIIVLGGSQETYCHRIAEAGGGEALLGKPLREVMALLKNAKLVIGNDTGLMHVAEALAVPAITIEGPTHPFLGFSPYRPSTKLLGLDLICRPCGKTGTICWRGGTRLCLRGISPEAVATQARAMVNQC